MFGFDLGKYRTIVISIALFLLFDLSVLVLNFFISSEIASDAVNVNLAGRQRMLTQRTAKLALLIERRARDREAQSAEVKELATAFNTFDSTLQAFEHGGQTLSGSGTPIRVEGIDDARAQDVLADARRLWDPYRERIAAVVANGRAEPEAAVAMARQAEAANLPLLKLMNDLTSRVEELAASKATTLRAVQITGMTLATINFLVILFHFIRHLRESDRLLERARRETDDILRTTQDGLFLLDADGRIGVQHSAALERVLDTDRLAGESFYDIIGPAVTPKTLDTTREYVDLLLRHDVKEKLVASLNPLECVEISLSRAPGDAELRYLQFGFNRVFEHGKVTHLLVTANDITRRVRLEKELQAAEARAKGQMGLLVEILQVEPATMNQFLRTAQDGLQHINRQLREQGSAREVGAETLNAIYRITHRIKGDASALGIGSLAGSLHSLEDTLSRLRERPSLSGEDFLPVTVRIKGLFEEIEAMHLAVSRVAQIRGVVSVEAPRPQHDPGVAALPFVKRWQDFAARLADEHGCKVELGYHGIDAETLPESLRDAINSMVNQFIRNAIVHGIEDPESRKRRGKPETGRIAVYISARDDGGVELSFRDDGQGITVAEVRDAAVRAGRLSADEAAAMDSRRIVSLIFEPGLSTRESADQDGGRGAGLDAVKAMVMQLGGQIRIGSTPGEYCHFRLSLGALPSLAAVERSGEAPEEAAA